MTALEKYYNKFDEEGRLKTRHGQVEFFVTYRNILDAAEEIKKKTESAPLKILDVGAATGAYSVPLSRLGFDVTAVEPVQKNLEKLRSKHEHVKCWKGDARSMHFLEDGTFDITLLLGPLYHLCTEEEKLKALSEAKRVTKKGGLIFCAYCMNEYAVIKYCFGENRIKEVLASGQLDGDFKTRAKEGDLYSYVRLEEINSLKEKAGLERVRIFSPDGPSDYMRRELNAMDEENFELFKKYA